MSEPSAYAPTDTTNYTIPIADYHHEVSRGGIAQSANEQDVLNSLAEIYSIITVLEMIETSFIKDYITDKEKYTSTALRLISQYQIIVKSFKEEPKLTGLCRFIPNFNYDTFLDQFVSTFNMNYPLAVKRLNVGVPVTIEHIDNNSNVNLAPDTSRSELNTPNQNTRLIAETTSNFITCMDALKLQYKTKEQLHPLLTELVVNLNELIEESSRFEFQGKPKLINWLIKLNNLVGELSSSEIEDFLNDLNVAYRNFYKTLE